NGQLCRSPARDRASGQARGVAMSRGLRWTDEQMAEFKKHGSAEIKKTNLLMRPKPSKYKNEKTDGYASKKEARRAAELKLMEKSGRIRNLREQVVYEL